MPAPSRSTIQAAALLLDLVRTAQNNPNADRAAVCTAAVHLADTAAAHPDDISATADDFAQASMLWAFGQSGHEGFARPYDVTVMSNAMLLFYMRATLVAHN